MVERSLLSIINMQTFHITSTIPIPIYSPPPLVIIAIVFHVSDIGMHPYHNSSFITLTSLSHRVGSSTFSLVTFLIENFIFSSLIPNDFSSFSIHSPLNTTDILSPSGGPSIISSGCDSIGIASPSGGAAYIGRGLRCAPDPPWWKVLVIPWPVGTTSGSFSVLPLSTLLLSVP